METQMDLVSKTKEELLAIFKEKVKENGGLKMAAIKVAHLSKGDLLLSHTRVSNAYYGRTSAPALREYIYHLSMEETDVKL